MSQELDTDVEICDVRKLVEETIPVTLYSIREFPKSLRAEFELPQDILFDETDQCVDYLKEIGVVHYRDGRASGEDSYGRIHVPNVGILVAHEVDYTALSEFNAWKHVVYLGRTDLKPAEWPILPNVPRVVSKPYIEQRIAKHGDMYAWLIWNEPVIVRDLSPNMIRVAH